MKLTEVSQAYNMTLNHIEEARQIFEDEAKSFSRELLKIIEIEVENLNREGTLRARRQWGTPDELTCRYGAATSFYSGAEVPMGIRPVGKSNLKNSAITLEFAIKYDNDLKQFVFCGQLNNSNSVSDQIDEKLFDILKESATSLPDAYQRHEVIRSDTLIAFKAMIDESLTAILPKLVGSLMRMSDQAVAELLPLEGVQEAA